jgi:hypothetical protein
VGAITAGVGAGAGFATFFTGLGAGFGAGLTTFFAGACAFFTGLAGADFFFTTVDGCLAAPFFGVGLLAISLFF